MKFRLLLPTLFSGLIALAPAAEKPAVPIEAESPDPKLAKIVLIPAPPDAKQMPVGAHEYFAGCAVLRQLLAQTPGVFPVMVEKNWPKKPSTFEGAKAVVFFAPGGGGQPTLTGDHTATVQKLVDAGVGIVHLHSMVDYPIDFGERARSWLGGCYEPKYSLRAHWVETFDKFPDHPVCRGVSSFTIDDGFLNKLKFQPDMKGVTPLLRTWNPKVSPKPPAGSPNDIVAWTYDRPTGGRSFCFTGGHLHESLKNESYRRFLTNGILWSAGVEIPTGGAKVDLEPADLTKYLAQK